MRLISLGQLAELAGVSIDTARRWVERKFVPARRVGPRGHFRVRLADAATVLQRPETELLADLQGATDVELEVAPANDAAGFEPEDAEIEFGG